MTGRWEFFTELDSSVQGPVKFGDASGVEIKGVGSVIFTTMSGEHRLLTGVYYIPALRNSISLGQLDENGSRVVVEDGVMRILGSPSSPSCQGDQKRKSTLRP